MQLYHYLSLYLQILIRNNNYQAIVPFVFVSDSSPSAEEVTATDCVDEDSDAIELVTDDLVLAVDPFSPRVVNPRY
jgi:hypothetical protein